VTGAPEVTLDMPGRIIAGEYLGRGVECAQMRLPTGEEISIEGQDFSEIALGTRLRLTGEFARMSRCMQGRAFVAASFKADDPP
jgi:hypothetical protein